jgi:hypothetical protein
MPIRTVVRCAAAALLAAAATSCGDVVRSSRSPVMLVFNLLQAAPGNSPGELGTNLNSDVITLLTTPAPCSAESPCPTTFNDVGSAALASVMRDVAVTPTSNNQVTINRYHVAYRRADGRNREGIDVPHAFDGAATATVVPGGTPTGIGFTIVRNAAKKESPLVELGSSPNLLDTIADVTFYGTDLVGNDVSVTGSILITFANFGDE